MSFKKSVAALLVVTMVFAVAGCSGGDKSWAAQLGEDKIAAGIYSLNVMTGITEASNRSGVAAEIGVDDIFKADIEGQTGSQFIVQHAKDETARQLAGDKKFKELGLTLTEEEVKTYEDYAKQMYASDTEMFKAIGVSEQSVIDYNRYGYQNYVLFNKLYGEGGEKAATAEEISKYFSENYYLCYVAPYLKVDAATGAALDEAALTTLRTNATTMQEAINKGEKSIVDVVHEETAKQMGQDPATMERGKDSDYLMVVDKVNMGYFPMSLTDYLATGTVGKLELIEDETYIMLVEKLDETKPDQELASYYYTQMLPQLKNEEFLGLLNQWAQEQSVTYNDAAIKHYTGEKIKKDTDAYLKKVESDAAASASSLPADSSDPAASDDPQAPESSSASDTGSSASN